LVGFSDAIVARIFKAIDRVDLSDDPRFGTNRDRNLHEAELRAIIADWAARLPREQALARLRDADVPAAPVWTLDDLLASGHVAARELLQPGVNRKLGDFQLVPQPVRFAGAQPVAPMRAPLLGEDTEQVLRDELGFDETRIAALRDGKAI
jgi:CoA:oxalate CoA-transferase